MVVGMTSSGHRARRAVAAATVVAALALAGCATGTDDEAGEAPEQPAPTAQTTADDAEDATTDRDAIPDDGRETTGAAPDAEPRPEPEAAPAPAPAAPGTRCGTVDSPRGPAPVVVLEGEADCDEVLATAEGYMDAPKEGNGGNATVGSWRCAVAVLPDRPMAESYIRCAGPSANAFRIGE